MAENIPEPNGEDQNDRSRSDMFPDTHSSLLRQAAGGDWASFLITYLQPCWRLVEIACRRRHLPLEDAEDIFSELMLRLIRDGEFKSASRGDRERYRGNLAGRYLEFRQMSPEKAVPFRNYLKLVIRNILRERVRQRMTKPRSLSELPPENLALAFEDAISDSVERWWIRGCFDAAARRLLEASRQAPTSGERRLFDVFCQNALHGLSATEIAVQLGLDRSTVSDLLSRSRRRFVRYLSEATGISDLEELKEYSASFPEGFLDALESAAKM